VDVVRRHALGRLTSAAAAVIAAVIAIIAAVALKQPARSDV
jgi:hypothetical protein